MAAKKELLLNCTSEEFAKFIEQPIWQYYDKSSKLYRFFASEAKMNAWVTATDTNTMNKEISAYELFNLTAPAPYEIKLPSLDDQYILEGITGNTLSFKSTTVRSDTGLALEEKCTALITFTNNGSSLLTSIVYSNKNTASLLIDQYLGSGENNITIVVTGMTSKATAIATITYNVVSIGIKSSFEYGKALEIDDNGYVKFTVPYMAWGAYDKFIEFYIDGSDEGISADSISSINDITEDSATLHQRFFNKKLTAGKHTLQLRTGVTTNDSSSFYSNTLYFEFIVTDGTEYSGTTILLILTSGTIVSNKTPLVLKCEQYEELSIDWSYFTSIDTNKVNKSIKWTLINLSDTTQETTVSTKIATIISDTNSILPSAILIVPDNYGSYMLTAYIDDTTKIAEYTVQISKTSKDIAEYTNGLILKLSAFGRSNDEPDLVKSVWDYEGIYSTTFENVQWSTNCGWDSSKGCLTLQNGASATINCPVFSFDPMKQGCTVEIDYETFNISDENAELIRIGGGPDNGQPEIVINPQNCHLTSKLKTTIKTQYKNDDRLKMSFIINAKENSSEPAILYIQTNGVRERAVPYGDSDSFEINSTDVNNCIKINSTGCGIRIYSIRVYQTALSTEDCFKNWVIDTSDISTAIDNNNILDDGEISWQKVMGKVDVILIDADVDSFFNNTADTTIEGSWQRYCLSDATKNCSVTGGRIGHPGQSTRGYSIPLLRLYSDKPDTIEFLDYDDQPVTGNYYAMLTGGIPEKKFRLNPNFVDSSCSNAGAFFHAVNTIFPNVSIDGEYVLRNPALKYAITLYSDAMKVLHPNYDGVISFPYSILNVPEPIPCVIFWRDTANDKTTYEYLSQYVMMDEKKAPRSYGQRSIYDTLDSKNNPDPFKIWTKGGNRLWSNENCLQFEVLLNAHSLAAYKSISTWDNEAKDDKGNLLGTKEWEQVFEQEYPDTDDSDKDGTTAEIVAKFKKHVTWLCSTYNNHTKFQNEAKTHLDLWKTAAYYVLMIKHGMVDNSVRNMEWRSDELNDNKENIWYPTFWDTDIQFGKRNDGALIFEPGIDRQSPNPDKEGDYAYAGHDNWLWDALEAWDEFMGTYVIKMNLALYDAGWKYSTVVENYYDKMFTSKWCERIYNQSMQSKYIDQYFNEGKEYLSFMTGRSTNQRHYWAKSSYNYWDAKWLGGEIIQSYIYLRAAGAGNGLEMHFKSANSTYYAWALTDTSRILQSGIEVNAGEYFDLVINTKDSYKTDDDGNYIYDDLGNKIKETSNKLGLNDPIVIYAASNIEEADFSEIALYLSSTLQFDRTYDSVLGTNIKKLNIGVPKKTTLHPISSKIDEYQTSTITPIGMEDGAFNDTTNIAFQGLGTMTRLEELNIQGYTALTDTATQNIQYLISLKRLYAAGSKMISFKPADGCSFEIIELPDTLTKIEANSVTWDTLTWYHTDRYNEEGNGYLTTLAPNYIPTSLTDLQLYNCGSNENLKQFVLNWIEMVNKLSNKSLYSLRLSGINWTSENIETLRILNSIDQTKRSITGYIQLETINTTEYNEISNMFGETCFNALASLLIDAEDTLILTGPTQINGNTTAQYSVKKFPLSKQSLDIEFLLYEHIENGASSYNNPIPVITDTETGIRYSICNHVKLYNDTGILDASDEENIITDSLFLIMAKYKDEEHGKTASSYVKVKHCTYPTSVSIIGEDLNGIDDYTYSLYYSPTEFTGKIIDVKWEFELINKTSEDVLEHVSKTSDTLLNCVLKVNELIKGRDTQYTLNATIKLSNNTYIYAPLKTLTLPALTYPLGINIIGETTTLWKSNGTLYNYIIELTNPTNYNGTILLNNFSVELEDSNPSYAIVSTVHKNDDNKYFVTVTYLAWDNLNYKDIKYNLIVNGNFGDGYATPTAKLELTFKTPIWPTSDEGLILSYDGTNANIIKDSNIHRYLIKYPNVTDDSLLGKTDNNVPGTWSSSNSILHISDAYIATNITQVYVNEEDLPETAELIYLTYNITWENSKTSIYKLSIYVGKNAPYNGAKIAGSIYCSDGTWINPFKVDDDNNIITTSTVPKEGYIIEINDLKDNIELNSKTPIGICVIPSNLMDDNCCRVMAFADISNYSYGTYIVNGIPKVPSYKIGSLESHDSVNIFNESILLFYSSYDATAYNPFTYDDTYKTKLTIDGYKYTNLLLDTMKSSNNDNEDWKYDNDVITGNITDYSGTIYPAAQICWLYNTDGTELGKWYLPSNGELGFIAYNFVMLNTLLSRLGKTTLLTKSNYMSSNPYNTTTDYASAIRFDNNRTYFTSIKACSDYHIRPMIKVEDILSDLIFN